MGRRFEMVRVSAFSATSIVAMFWYIHLGNRANLALKLQLARTLNPD